MQSVKPFIADIIFFLKMEIFYFTFVLHLGSALLRNAYHATAFLNVVVYCFHYLCAEK